MRYELGGLITLVVQGERIELHGHNIYRILDITLVGLYFFKTKG